MNLKDVRFDNFCVTVSGEWEDITASLDDPKAPYTIAKPESGVGALQFTPAVYRGGAIPSPSMEDLEAMLTEFARHRELGQPIEHEEFSSRISRASSTFRSGSDFVRVWYLSDGRNIMLATYVCDWSSRLLEAEECETIIRSLRFVDA